MLNRVLRWGSAFFLLGMGTLALVAGSALLWAVWPENWRGEGAAAWVQAVGSVAALGIAIYVPWRQRLKEDDERQIQLLDARGTRMSRLFLISLEADQYAHEILDSARPTSEGIKVFDFDREHGVSLLDRLKRIQDEGLDIIEQDMTFSLRNSLAQLIAAASSRRHSSIEPSSSQEPRFGLGSLASRVDIVGNDIANVESDIRRQLRSLRPQSLLDD